MAAAERARLVDDELQASDLLVHGGLSAARRTRAEELQETLLVHDPLGRAEVQKTTTERVNAGAEDGDDDNVNCQRTSPNPPGGARPRRSAT